MSKLYVLYDGRARLGETDDATAYTTERSEEECLRTADTYGVDAIWYEYDEEGDQLVNETIRYDLSPGGTEGKKPSPRKKKSK